MNALLTILKKELRSYFLSPVALIFLGIFLVANLFVFFTYATFFARNIADVRPMFEWMPILLIFLVAAISMRSWSEEQAGGTLEILMTLPVRTLHLVLGKLGAGMVLVLVALALTLPLPIMVSFLGEMDPGPVVGGYLGALFLGSAYLAIGMCVSARTDNQLVSLMVTAVIGALFYLAGSDTVAGFFGANTGELLRAIGTGSRFYNIERGVLDLRDIFYYVSITLFFIALNVHFLDAKRVDTRKSPGRRRALVRLFTTALVGLNVVIGNLWLAPVTGARADLTADGQFSVSESTTRILDGLSEPLVLAGYFSENTHPLLSPLVPAVRDFLMEYKNAGNGRVTVRFDNPNADEALEQEIAQSYNIKPLPFRVAERHQESVVNAYFHILVKYGDEYEVLSIDDLVEAERNGDSVDVRLKNLEYDLARSIKRVSSGFQSIESVFARMEEKSRLTFFVTPSTLPSDLKDAREHVKTAAEDLASRSGGKFLFEEVDLDNNPDKQKQVMETYGFRPLAVDLFGEQTYFLHLLLATGDKLQRILLQGTPTEAAVKSAIESAFKRNTPGFLKTIGLVTEKPEQPQRNPQLPPQMQPPPARADYTILERQLQEEFTVRRLDLLDGIVPPEVDVLIVAKTGALDEKQKFAIDQYLMAGGSVIALAGDRRITADQTGINAVPEEADLKDMLASYGVKIKEGFVLDAQNASFPVPVEEQKGMFVMRKIKMMDYPFFPDIRKDGFAEDHITTSGMQNVIFNWGSSIELATERKDVSGEVVLQTSDRAWLQTDNRILPSSFDNASSEFAPPEKLSQYNLAAVLEGAFTSYFADRDSPLFTDDGAPASTQEGGNPDRKIDRTGRTIKQANKNARLVVVGSSEFLSDLTASLGEQIAGNVYRSNFQFARNLIDWALADTDLLQIRTSGTFARTLNPIDDGTRNIWEIVQYLFVVLALGAVILFSWIRRRNATSLLRTEAVQ